jgi:hypothetical protein
MHAALWQLLWFDICGSLRSLRNVHKHWRQLMLFLLMLLFVGVLLTARTWSGVGNERFGEAMPFWALIYLSATWLTAAADRGLVMRPAEIHFVVGGPFPNRDVITLNLVRLACRALISAWVLSIIAMAYVPSYASALLGMWLLISVSLLMGMVVSLSSRKIHRRRLGIVRRVLSLVALVTLLLLVVQSMRQLQSAGFEPRIASVAATAMQTPLGQVILPPLAWMFAPLSAENFFTDTLSMMPARLSILALLVGMVYLLGGQYAETSTGRTDVSVARRHAALRSGVVGGTVSSSWTRRLTLPLLHRLGGVGSVAWMQMVHSIRILPRYLLFTSAIVGVVLVVPLMVDSRRLAGTAVVGWMAGLTSYADFLLLLQLPVGFLGPVAQREQLKSLPIPAWCIALGQLAGAFIPLAILHLLVSLLFLILIPDSTLDIVVTSLALIPVALVLVANINLLGAWNIIRPRALQQRDALAAGRAMASVWIFMAMLTPAVILASLCALLLAMALGTNLFTILIGVSVGLILSSGLYIGLLARSFDRWQPSATEGGMEEVEYDR